MTIKYFSPKQSYEEYYISFNFKNVLGDDTITSATVTVVDALGADATSTLTTVGSQVISGSNVNVWVKAGTAQRYKITCKIVSSSEEKYEQDAYIVVEEE